MPGYIIKLVGVQDNRTRRTICRQSQANSWYGRCFVFTIILRCNSSHVKTLKMGNNLKYRIKMEAHDWTSMKSKWMIFFSNTKWMNSPTQTITTHNLKNGMIMILNFQCALKRHQWTSYFRQIYNLIFRFSSYAT